MGILRTIYGDIRFDLLIQVELIQQKPKHGDQKNLCWNIQVKIQFYMLLVLELDQIKILAN